MKKALLVLMIMATHNLAHAGTLIVTCGKNAYESLESKNLNSAEFVLKLKTKGPNNPPEITTIRDDGRDISAKVTGLNYKLPSITVSIQGSTLHMDHKYEITEIQACSSIETGTAKVVYFQNKGGFAGATPAAEAKCSCLDREP